MNRWLGSGLTLAAVLGTAVLHERAASACSEPDTGTRAGKAWPFGVTDENPYYWEPSAGVPAGGDAPGDDGASGTGDPAVPKSHQALLLRFSAGNDRDSDPNRDYFKHAHRAFTIVTVSDARTGAVVRTERVPVWDYGAIDRGARRQGDAFRRIEAVRIDALPPGQYRVQTQALFVHPDGDNSNWGGPLQGEPASTTFVVEPGPQSNEVVGGCQAGRGASSPAWLALGGLALVLARRTRRTAR